MTIRTRLAPSPTGDSHIGHIRTLLYNYAFTKQNNGMFILRIEDTDRVRYVEGSIERILKVITAYGFNWDEGPGVNGPFAPYIQSERLDLYRKYALELVESGHAYYCFCSKERLDQLREEQQQKKLPVTKYDRKCLSLSKEEIAQRLKNGESYVIRLKMPDNEIIAYNDLIHGDISFNSNSIDDQVLLKADGYPTYQLAVVVDDHLMGVTHILRGIDWIPSTPKHVLLYKYLGWTMPLTGHLPNLKELGGDKKLSKRFGSVAAYEFLQEGYLVDALINFLMFLGWNPGTSKEIYTMAEFIKDFSLEKITKAELVGFDRNKLLWMNGYYIRQLKVETLYELLMQWSRDFNISLGIPPHFTKEYIYSVLTLVQDRMRKLSDFIGLTGYFFDKYTVDRNILLLQTSDSNRSVELIKGFIACLEQIIDTNWTTEILDKICHEFVIQHNYKPKEAFMTLRVAITGETATPPIFDILRVLGKEVVIKRLRSL